MKRKLGRNVLSLFMVFALILGMTTGAAAFSVAGAESVTSQSGSGVSEDALKTLNGIKANFGRAGLVGFTGDNELPGGVTPVSVIVLFNHMPAQTVAVEAANAGIVMSAFEASEISQSDHDLFRQEMDELFRVSPGSRSAKAYEITSEYHVALNGVAVTMPADKVAELAGFDSVYAVYPNSTVYREPVEREETVAYGNKSGNALGRAAMNVDRLREEEGIDGSGVEVCIIDTGIDYYHPDFEGAFGTQSPRGSSYNSVDLHTDGYFYGRNFVTEDIVVREDNDPMEATYEEWLASRLDEYNDIDYPFYTYHGTHVSGTVAARGTNNPGNDAAVSALGVAPGATIYVYRVFGAYSAATTESIFNAIEYVDTDKPDVVNMSLGATVNDPYHLYTMAVNNVILNNRDIVFAISAGNMGSGMYTLGSPATSPAAITVGNASAPETRESLVASVRFKSSVDAPDYDDTFTVNLFPLYMHDDEWYEVDGGGNVTITYDELKTSPDGSYTPLEMPCVSHVECGGTEIVGTGTEEEFAVLASQNGDDISGKFILIRRGSDFLGTMALAKEYHVGGIILFNRSEYTSDPSLTTAGLDGYRGSSENYVPFFYISNYNDGSNFQYNLFQTEYSLGEGLFTIPSIEGVFFPVFIDPSSSNGPVKGTYDIKPDVVSHGSAVTSTAPIMSAGGTYEDAYLTAGGTSMSSPHVAGVAALMRQYSNDEGLDWTSEEIKARMMNTASVVEPYTEGFNTTTYGVYVQGAGYVDAYAAIYGETSVSVEYEDNAVVGVGEDGYSYASFDSGAFSFGWFDVNSPDEQTFELTATVTNNSGGSKTYSVDSVYSSFNAGGGTGLYSTIEGIALEGGYGFDIDNDSLSVAAGGFATFTVTVTVPAGMSRYTGSLEGYITVTDDSFNAVSLPFALYGRDTTPPLVGEDTFVNRPVISAGEHAQTSYSGDLDVYVTATRDTRVYAYLLDYELSAAAKNPDGTVDFETLLTNRAFKGDLNYAVELFYDPYGDNINSLNEVVSGGLYYEFVGYDEDGYPTDYGDVAALEEGPATILLWAVTSENEHYYYYADFYVDNTPPELTVDSIDMDGDYNSYTAALDGSSPIVLSGTVYDSAIEEMKALGLEYEIWELGDPYTGETDYSLFALYALVGGEYVPAIVNAATGEFTLTLPASADPFDVALFAIDGFSIRRFDVLFSNVKISSGFDPFAPSLGDYCTDVLGLMYEDFGFVGSNLTTLEMRVEDGSEQMLVRQEDVSIFAGESAVVTALFNGAAVRAGDRVVSAVAGNPGLVSISVASNVVTVNALLEGSTSLTITSLNGLEITLPLTVKVNAGHGTRLDKGGYVNYGAMNHVAEFEWTTHFWFGTVVTSSEYEEEEAPILWKVMGNEILPDGSVGNTTLLSEYVLDVVQFDGGTGGINRYSDGGDYNLRHWLNGGTYAVYDWDTGGLMPVPTESQFFHNFSEGELDAAALVTNNVSLYVNGQRMEEYTNTVYGDKFFLPWLSWTGSSYFNLTYDVFWSAGDNIDSRNALVTSLTDSEFAKAGAIYSTFRNGVPHGYWTETISDAYTAVHTVRASDDTENGIIQMVGLITLYDGIRPGTTLDMSRVVYAEKDSSGVYKLTVAGTNNGTDIGSFTGDIASSLVRELEYGENLTVSGGLTGSGYDAVMYKIVDNSSNDIVAYGELDGEELASNGSATIGTSELGNGSYKIYVWPQKNNDLRSNEAGETTVLNVNVSGQPTVNPGNPSTPSGNGTTEQPSTEQPTTEQPEGPVVVVQATVSENGTVGVSVSADEIAKAVQQLNDSGESAVTISVTFDENTKTEDIKDIEVTIPAAAAEGISGVPGLILKVETPIAEVTFDSKAFNTITEASDGDIRLVISVVDKETLDLSEQELSKIGSRPVYDFTVMKGETEVSNFMGGKATINIPYTPAPGENLNAIIVYYIDDDGNLKTMRGKYNAETGTVEVVTTHFSKFAVAYNPVSFDDVPATHGSKQAIDFIAARGITTGVGKDMFAPNGTLTRAQFLVMIMRAYGIDPDENPTDNFADAGNTYYTGYLAAAKRLGLASGVGNNMYSPERAVTREEMFVLVYNTLKAMNEVPNVKTGAKPLSDYLDEQQVASWAREAVQALVESGTITGDGTNIMPKSQSKRYQMAQVLYNLLSR